MSNEDDSDPIVEVHPITLWEYLDLMRSVPGELYGPVTNVEEMAPGTLFDSAPPEVQATVLAILRAVSKRGRRGRPAPEPPRPGTSSGDEGGGREE